MSDRVMTLTVALDREYRTDDVESIVNAVRMVKGVADVELGPVANHAAYAARETVLNNFTETLWWLCCEVRANSDVWKRILKEAQDQR